MKGKFSLILVIIAFVAGFIISNITGKYRIVEKEQFKQNTNLKEQTSSSNFKLEKSDALDNRYNDKNIPTKIYDVIEHIKKYNKAPDGYVGGRQFMNYEKLLPEEDENGNKITYQEWDVNPKIAGKNRGKERLVTSSDGRAYFTNDHYESFNEIKLFE